MGTPYDALVGANKSNEQVYAEAAARAGKKNTATYIDRNGNRQTGTIAPNAGSANLAAAAEPADTEDAGYWARMAQSYKDILDQQVAANDESAAAATEQALAMIAQKQGELAEGYAGTNRQLYRDRMQAERVLPQQLAAQGYTGGLAETARVGLATAYGENLAGNERARLGSAAALDAEGVRAGYENELAARQANLEAQTVYQQYMAQIESGKYQEQQTRAQQMAAVGDFTGYEALGYAPEQITLLREAWIAQNPELARKLGYVKSGGGGDSDVIAKIKQKMAEMEASGISAANVNGWVVQSVDAGYITPEQAREVLIYGRV